eukprot:MONOS_11562.1-p1 / transcript=MONOS_11562.1 / gene=MONOS_11562 / organism=Monocercomonoides_exilis_PA203 / gene_product=unspecified product / transcript_product=unspecified product / location=Mono_scaffold00586:39173-39938(+) / protein_length=194 / sequence_SO=supercontig / SO=protein_coding / is_pseudo=false
MNGLVGQLGAGGCCCLFSECYLICQGGGGRSWGCFATEEFFDDPGSWVGQNGGEGDGSNGNGDWEGCSVETMGYLGFAVISASIIISTPTVTRRTEDVVEEIEREFVPTTLTAFPFPVIIISFSPTLIVFSSLTCLPPSTVIVELSCAMLDPTACPTVLQGADSLIPHRLLESSPLTPTYIVLSFNHPFFSVC